MKLRNSGISNGIQFRVFIKNPVAKILKRFDYAEFGQMSELSKLARRDFLVFATEVLSLMLFTFAEKNNVMRLPDSTQSAARRIMISYSAYYSDWCDKTWFQNCSHVFPLLLIKLKMANFSILWR